MRRDSNHAVCRNGAVSDRIRRANRSRSVEETSLSDSLDSAKEYARHTLQKGRKGAQIREIIATLLRCFALQYLHLISIHFKNWLALEKAILSAVGTLVLETNEIARISGDS